MKGLSPKRLKLTELSTFYKHFLHPRLTQSATQRLYLFVNQLRILSCLSLKKVRPERDSNLAYILCFKSSQVKSSFIALYT